MMPENVLSTTPVTGNFIQPRDRVKEPLIDYARGGVALNDASQGLDLYNWRGQYIDGDIVLDVPGVVAPTTVASIADVTEFQFTFDQNMQPFIAYTVSDTDAHYRWYDGTVPGFVTGDLASGTYTPRCALDDRRLVAGNGVSDIILAYMNDDTLYFRMQRDRYEDEYKLDDTLAGYELGQIGFNSKLRMQFQMVPREPS